MKCVCIFVDYKLNDVVSTNDFNVSRIDFLAYNSTLISRCNLHF